MSIDLLAYQQGRKDRLRQAIRHNSMGGTRQVETSLRQDHLLRPPCSMGLSLAGYKGQAEDLIGIWVDHDFGIAALHVTIHDEQGNLVEKEDCRGDISGDPGR